MGRLLEAIKKREQDLLNYLNLPGGAPKVSEDPQKGYDYILRLNELSYLRKKSGSYLTAALAAMSSEQRREFFVQNFNENRLAELAKRNFKQALAKAYAADKDNSFVAFLQDEKTIGWPLNVIVAGMRNSFTRQRLQTLQEKLAKEKPDASLEEQAKFYYSNMGETQLFALYDDVVQDDCKEEYLRKALDDHVENGKIGTFMTNPTNFKKGMNYLKVVGMLEQIMDPRLAEETAKKIEEMPRPHLDPNKTVTPYAQRIGELQNGLAPQDPSFRLLERVKGILVYPSQDYLLYLNNKDGEVEGVMGLQQSMDSYTFLGGARFLQKNLKAPLLGKLPHSNSQAGDLWYDPVDVHPVRKIAVGTAGVDMDDAELQTLRQKAAGAPIAPAVKQAVHDFMACIDQMGEKTYWIDEVVTVEEGTAEDPKKVAYKPEQGNKKYAFWPLVLAKNSLAEAVEKGDLEEIRKAEAEYQRRRDITDRMMEAANRTATVPLFGGNVNSTRPDDDGNGLNAMPTEYLEDYAGHSRANGLFLLYAASKNTGIPVDRLLDDPGGALRDYGEQFRQKKLLSSQKDRPLGARLLRAFDSRQQINAEAEWNFNLGLISRGLNAVNGLIPDEESRVNNIGRNYCAEAAAGYEVGQESVPWKNLSSAKPEQKQLVMQLAMLLPEEEFRLRDLGMAFSRNDWLKQLNPLSAIARLKAEHKLDYGAVTARSKELLAQVEAAVRAGEAGPRVDLNDYREAALRNYNQLLRTMPADQRKSEGCRQMRAHAAELQNGLVRDMLQGGEFQEDRDEINTKLRTLSKRKSGWFLDEEDSTEYTRMVKSIKLLNQKLDLLEGKALPADLSPKVREKLQTANVAELINAAKYNCYNYARLKTKDGKSGIIHTAGQERLQCAMDLYEKLGLLSTHLCIRQPAVELKDLAKMELLKNRRSWSWEAEDTKVCAARMIYALSLQYQSVPKQQQLNLIDNSLDQAVERIMNQPAFRQMVRNEGSKGLADKIVAGTSALTEAYMKAVRQVAQHDAQHQAAPQTSKEEKIDFWRQHEDPAAAPEGPAPHL